MSEAKQAKSYKDSNVAGLGSDADKEARVGAAKTEKAWVTRKNFFLKNHLSLPTDRMW